MLSALNCKMLALDTISLSERSLAVYTDGSKDESGRTGASLHIQEAKVYKGLRLTEKLSVYATELTAIQVSLEWIITNQKSEYCETIEILQFLQTR